MRANSSLPTVTALLVFAALLSTAFAVDPQLPSLPWTERSDWINVKTDVTPGAVGDGVNDDTAAIQAAFDLVTSGSTLYLPAGVYRITSTVTLTGPMVGVTVIGHGRDTVLRWDGAAGGVIYKDDGISSSRIEGIEFQGQGVAGVGFLHESDNRFETEVMHKHLAFRDFTEGGIIAATGDAYALAEATFDNCIFDTCAIGISFTSFNDYNFTFNACEFLDCGTGIYCSHGNFYVRDTHFERSTVVDIHSAPEHASSVRRSTSVGSARFLMHSSSVSAMTVQDCHVSGWTNTAGAVFLSGAPAILFDCVFTDPPGGTAPVYANGTSLRLIVSENVADGSAALIQGATPMLYTVPAGQYGGSIESATQRFHRDTAEIPGVIYDAKVDFGAAGDGIADDTAEIQAAIDAARAHGAGAIAYLPSGRYNISDTLDVHGGDYYIGGTGFRTQIAWKGAADGTMMAVHDPQDITLQHFAIGNHDSGAMNNAIDIHQTSSGAGSSIVYDGVFVYGMYQRDPLNKGLVCTGLGPNDTVVIEAIQGNLRFVNCARATILGNCTWEGSVIVEGDDVPRDGFLGFMTRLSTITTHGLYLRDNHSIVMSDFYVEQANNGYAFAGDADDPPGRATIQGAKVDFAGGTGEAWAMDINNYGGQIFFGHNQFYASLESVDVRQQGDADVDLFLIADLFYAAGLELTATDALTLYRVGCRAVGGTTYDPTDTVTPAVLLELAKALDDLRMLGRRDLELNHGVSFEEARHSGDYWPASGVPGPGNRERDGEIDLHELLRIVQFYNHTQATGEGLHVDDSTEDGYALGDGAAGTPHSADYWPAAGEPGPGNREPDWEIDLSELLRIIQLYNAGGYHEDASTEDGFAPGP